MNNDFNNPENSLKCMEIIKNFNEFGEIANYEPDQQSGSYSDPLPNINVITNEDGVYLSFKTANGMAMVSMDKLIDNAKGEICRKQLIQWTEERKRRANR
jgi:hypothetical protein